MEVNIMSEIKVTNLAPIHSGNKSFYGKAKVIEMDGVKYLKSYSTIVCAIKRKKLIKFWDDYSATTQKHISDFCNLYGIKSVGKKEWLDMPTNPKNLDIPEEVKNIPMNYKTTYYGDAIYNPYI